MKLPRGISAERLIRVLHKLGYEVVRQKGSHVRMKYDGPPVHLLTIPFHNPLKIGTLHAILSDIAQMRSIPIESIIEQL